MGPKDNARSHLHKAREFLEATKAVEWATRLVDAARDATSS